MHKKKLDQFFAAHQQEMVDDICTLIRINSVADEPKEGKPFGEGPARALQAAQGMADRMGFATKNWDNYVVTADLGSGEACLDILAHMDVVPVGDGWTVTQPFEPVVKDGRLYGRGAVDDKGPALAAMYAMRAVKELGVPVNKRVRLILGSDEETGSSDIRHYYGIEPEAPMTFSPDAEFPVINIEKGALLSVFTAEWAEEAALPRIRSVKSGTAANVIPDKADAVIEGMAADEARRYCEAAATETGVAFTVTETADGALSIAAKGVSAHASTPEGGNNALTALVSLLAGMPFAPGKGFEALKSVSRIYPHGDWAGKAAGVAMSDAESGALTICFDIFDYTPTGLTGTSDCRAPICANSANVRDVLMEKMAQNGLTHQPTDMRPPHHVPADGKFVRTLLKCYEEYTGEPGRCLAMGGGTYVHNLENGVAFGCMRIGTDYHLHGDDEFAVVDELVLSAKIFAQVILDLCC